MGFSGTPKDMGPPYGKLPILFPYHYHIFRDSYGNGMGVVWEAYHTWRIIPVSKYIVTPIYKPFRPFGRGTTLLRGLTNHGY